MNRIIICPSYYDHVAHLPVPAHRRSHVAAACGFAPHDSGAERECSRQRAPTGQSPCRPSHMGMGRCLKLLLTRGSIRTRIDRRGRRDRRGVSSYGFPGWTSEINRTARVLRRGSTAGHADRQFFGGESLPEPRPAGVSGSQPPRGSLGFRESQPREGGMCTTPKRGNILARKGEGRGGETGGQIYPFGFPLPSPSVICGLVYRFLP